MNAMRSVAFSELTRVLPWSLRAKGYAFGVAERGAHLVTAAAAMTPTVLDEICQAENRPPHRFRHERSKGLLTLDAADISLLEIGPVAIDSLAAHAGNSGWQKCLIPGATGLSLLPATLVGAIDYGLCSIGIVADDNGFNWHLAESDAAGSLYCGRGRASLDALLCGNEELRKEIDVVGLDPGSVLLMASAVPPELKPSDHAVLKLREKIATAQARGITVSRVTLDALYALEMITWAPTSERSRSQAGFTVAPVPIP